MAGEIKLTMEGSDLDPKTAADPLCKPVRFKQVAILKRKVADAGSLKRARDVHKDIFAALAREDEDGLVADFRTWLTGWDTDLRSFATVAAQKHYPGKTTIDALTSRIGKRAAIRDPFEFIEALNKDKDVWLDAREDVSDLSAFYKQQVSTWRKLLDALAVFEANREALLKDAKAAPALKELEALRANAAPYTLINRIDLLLATVQAVNDQLAQEKREKALQSVDDKIKEAQDALGKANASPDLSNKVLLLLLLPLQQLKIQLAAQSSIPQILYLQGQGGDRLDEAMDAIAAAMPKPPPVAAAPPPPFGASTPVVPTTAAAIPAAVPKPSQVVRAADLSPKTYLEAEAEVDAYVASLKARLVAVLHAGQRVRIQ